MRGSRAERGKLEGTPVALTIDGYALRAPCAVSGGAGGIEVELQGRADQVGIEAAKQAMEGGLVRGAVGREAQGLAHRWRLALAPLGDGKQREGITEQGRYGEGQETG